MTNLKEKKAEYKALNRGNLNGREEELENRMRKLEYYHSLCVPNNLYFIIRLDGKGFHRFTANMDKPFDQRFNKTMSAIAMELAKTFNALFVETHSDEISILVNKDWDFYNRKVEKIVSVSAGIASGLCSLEYKQLASFDSRVVLITQPDEIVDYYQWRRNDSVRNAINSLVYHQLRGEGLSPRKATTTSKGWGFSQMNDFLHERGVNFNDIDERLRRGTGIQKYMYQTMGFNPMTQQEVPAIRNGYKEIAVPIGEEYGELLNRILAGDTFE